MDYFKAVLAFAVSSLLIVYTAFSFMPFSAESAVIELEAELNGSISNNSMLEGIDCKSAAVFECGTGTMLAAKDSNKRIPAGHMSKLAVFLAAAKLIEKGELSPDDIVTVSAKANSMGDPQIWLDAGEKISVKELMLAISVGNANDACVALAEHISNKASDFTTLLPEINSSEDVKFNSFIDYYFHITENGISSAKLCNICSELVKLKDFSSYFTTWMETVRNGKAELVSRNRLIRTYKGIHGFKVCYSEASGYCAAICAEKGDMTVCCVLLGASDEDRLLSDCATLLDASFSGFEVYYPEIPEEALLSVTVKHGQREQCDTSMPGLHPIIIKKGTYKSISCEFALNNIVTAPAPKGASVGNIRFLSDGKEILSSDITLNETLKEVDIWFNLHKLLFNLLNL